MSLNTALSNTGPKRRGSPIPIILILLVLGAGGYFGWKAFSGYQADKLRRQEEIRAENERIRAKNERILKSGAKPKTNAVAQVEEDEPKFDLPPEPPKKTEAETLREEESFRTNVWAQIEAARKKGDAKPLPAFAGIQFGKPLVPGASLEQVSPKIVKWGTALREDAGGSVAARGVAFAVYGPQLAKPFMSLGTSPLVWVTPKERRPYRIEFSRPLAPKADKHDPETTNLVAMIQSRFKVEPFAPRPSVPGRAGCEYVFPIGTSTVTVGEYDGTLRFSVEREDVRDEARAETEALRQEKGQVSADGALLDSKRYPNGGFDRAKYRGMQPFQEGTPPAFCGVVFGSQPPETAEPLGPQTWIRPAFELVDEPPPSAAVSNVNTSPSVRSRPVMCLVPSNVMPETYAANNTSQMSSHISAKLREDGLRLRAAKAKDRPAMKLQMLKEVYRILALCLGVPPTEFSWARYNSKGEFVSEKNYTPKSFYQEFIGRVYNALQEQVGLFQLVVEKEVVLGEGEGAQVMLFNHAGTEHVQAREKPASARRKLVGPSLGLYLVAEMGVNHGYFVGRCGQDIDGRGVERIAEGLVGPVALVRAGQLGEHLGGNAALGILGEGSDGKQQRCQKEGLFHIRTVSKFYYFSKLRIFFEDSENRLNFATRIYQTALL